VAVKLKVFAKEAYVAAALPYFLDTRRLKGSKKTWQCGFTSTSNARDIDFQHRSQISKYFGVDNSSDITMSDQSLQKSTVFVGGLSHEVTSQTLHDAFIPFGEIVDVSLPKPEL
jgi:hypothetical protein